MKKEYTVVLLRPQLLSEQEGVEFGKDIFVSFTDGSTLEEALRNAKEEVFRADRKEGLKHPLVQKKDYKLCLMLYGHVAIAEYGWQSPD